MYLYKGQQRDEEVHTMALFYSSMNEGIVGKRLKSGSVAALAQTTYGSEGCSPGLREHLSKDRSGFSSSFPKRSLD